MNTSIKFFLALVGVATLGACTGGSTHLAPVDEVRLPGNYAVAAAPVPSDNTVAAPTETAVDAYATQLPRATAAAMIPLPSATGKAETPRQGSNPAVVTLLNQANQHTGTGQSALAAASLERALRIEPSNPWLWYRLAVSRQALGELDLAVNLASKSISLAGTKPRLQAENWQLIADIRRAQGLTADAELAAGKAQLILAQIQ